MYPISNDLLTIFQGGGMQYARLTIGNSTIGNDRIKQGSFSINRYVETNESVAIGSVVAAELVFVIDNYDGAYDNTNFVGTEAYVEIGVKDSNNTVQYIPQGYFTFDEATRTKNTISLAALDRMTKFDIPVNASQLSFPYTLTNLLSRICTLCNVTKGSFGTITNSSYSVASLPSEAKTYRDLLRWICELSGSNAYISYDGKLYLGWYGTTSQFNILPSNRTSSDIDKNTFTITGVTVLTGDNQKYTAGTNVRPITINNNPFITTTQAQSVANTLNTKLGGFSYCPFTAVMLPSPMIYPMDRATFTTADGTTVAVSVTEVTYKLNGNTSIGCKGEMQVRGRSYGLADQTFYASNIAAGAVTADKISVDDLAALQATIGGWTINETNLASSNNAVVLNSAGEIDVTETGSSATGAKIVATTSTNKAYYSANGVRIETPPNSLVIGSKAIITHDGFVSEVVGTPTPSTINGVSLTNSNGNPALSLMEANSNSDVRNEQTEEQIRLSYKDKTVTPNKTSEITVSVGDSEYKPSIKMQDVDGTIAQMNTAQVNVGGGKFAVDVQSTKTKVDIIHSSGSEIRIDTSSDRPLIVDTNTNNYKDRIEIGKGSHCYIKDYVQSSNKTYYSRWSDGMLGFGSSAGNRLDDNVASFETMVGNNRLQISGHNLLRMTPHFAQMFATEIPANANLNTTDYLVCGQYYSSVSPTTFLNCPTNYQFEMKVTAMIYSGYDDESESSDKYRIRTITDYFGNQFIQRCVKPTNGSWSYQEWKRVVSSSNAVYTDQLDTRNKANNATIRQGSLSGTGVETSGTTRIRTGYIGIEPNSNYYIATNSSLQIYEIHEYTASAFVKYTAINATSTQFKTSGTTTRIRVLMRYSDNRTVTTDEGALLQICKSTTEVEYSPFQPHYEALIPLITFEDVGASSGDSTFFPAWLRRIGRNYDYYAGRFIKAIVQPNSQGVVYGYMYGGVTSDYMPMYSGFTYIGVATMRYFGTNNGTFYIRTLSYT